MRGTLYAWGCGEQGVLGCRRANPNPDPDSNPDPNPSPSPHPLPHPHPHPHPHVGCRLGAARPKAKLLPTHPLALRRGRASLPVVSAAAGAYHSLALTADGEVWA